MSRPAVVLAAAALLALLSAVVAALVGPGPGLAALALALTVAVVGSVLSQREVYRRMDRQLAFLEAQQRRLDRHAERSRRHGQLLKREIKETRHLTELVERVVQLSADTGRRVMAMDRARPRTHQLIAESHGRLDRVAREMRRDAFRFRTGLDTLPSDILRLARTVDRLVPGTGDIPGLGDWAVTPATLLSMLDEMYRRTGPVHVLECGSGSSTLLFALALQDRGGEGHVIALESDPEFAQETREHLRHHGVEDMATVVDAPIVDVDVPGSERQPWFDVSALPSGMGSVDILFVDGPVGSTSVQARYPAFPLLADLLAPDALVVLDDIDRPDEQHILRRWLDPEAHLRRLVLERTNVRSSFLRVGPEGDLSGPV